MDQASLIIQELNAVLTKHAATLEIDSYGATIGIRIVSQDCDSTFYTDSLPFIPDGDAVA